MKRPHVSIARLMLIVGAVAYNLAAFRLLVGWAEFGGFVLIGLALQAGLLGLIRNRPGPRPFWAGYLVAGLAAMIVPFVVAHLAEEGSWPLRFLEWYVISTLTLVERACLLISDTRSQLEWTLYLVQDVQIYIVEVAIFLPQLAVAVAGGLVSAFVAKRLGRVDPGGSRPEPGRERTVVAIDPHRTEGSVNVP